MDLGRLNRQHIAHCNGYGRMSLALYKQIIILYLELCFFLNSLKYF